MWAVAQEGWPVPGRETKMQPLSSASREIGQVLWQDYSLGGAWPGMWE